MSPHALLHRDLGLTDGELGDIEARLGRRPTHTELAMFSVMWSEHCSYKSSRTELRALPTEAPWVVVGPGEGAGVVQVAPGVRVAWKMESHNHPSFVEPFNGAATGVGGIVRDILSMGARPIALLDSLRFGPLGDARTRYLTEQVVAGISAYGNSIGVPTVGGELVFDDCYEANPLVNVACLGIIEGEVVRARADRPGDFFVLFGAATGRDGIGGASVLASAAFDSAPAAKRPSVQIGDPFSEKLLIEATLELVSRGLVRAVQDLGAGGISCPASEMAAKSGTGMRLDLDRVHVREPAMEPFEVAISESQERMAAVVAPERAAQVLDVCARWGLDARVVGEVTSTTRLELAAGGARVADVPAAALAEEAPVRERPRARPEWLDDLQSRPPGDEPPASEHDALLALLAQPSLADKRWVYEQYDYMIGLGTVVAPGGDAAVVRLPGTEVAVAMSLDGPGRSCLLDPYGGAQLAVAEAARNVACTGARPLAVTNCLNLGNPERPEVAWQLAEVVRGIADACTSLGTPVVGGNVSLYNETGERAIHPTPVIGALGVIDDASRALGSAFARPGDAIVLLGLPAPGGFAGSDYAQVLNGVVAGRPPVVDLGAEARLAALLAEAGRRGLVASAHDVSSGGLAVCLAECAVAAGIGFEVGTGGHEALFSESPGRAVVSVPPPQCSSLLGAAEAGGVPAEVIGAVGGDELRFGSCVLALEHASATYRAALTDALSSSVVR
jgi:phosphoribosylformylglycinamidine synthase subunit PurL